MKGSHIVGEFEVSGKVLSLVADLILGIDKLGGSALERKEKLESIISQLRRMNEHLYSMTDEEILEE